MMGPNCSFALSSAILEEEEKLEIKPKSDKPLAFEEVHHGFGTV